MRAFLFRARYWAIIGGASIVAALAGPFYTFERMSFPARLLYWGGTAILSGVLMTLLSILMRRVAVSRGWHWAPASFLTGLLGILPVMAFVHGANQVSGAGMQAAEFLGLFPYVAIPVVIITILVNAGIEDPVLTPAEVADETAVEDSPQPAALLFTKLPGTLGKEIVSLQAKDHYIEVTTPLGSALVLMRMGDAEQDLAALDGMRVHRSWWVSLPHVARIEKGSNGPELRMTTGQCVPVARGQRAEVKSALAARGHPV